MKFIITHREELEVLVKTSVEQSLKSYFNQKQERDQKKEKLTVKETAHFLNVSELTVRNYIKRGLVKAERIGSRILINREKLEASLKEVKSLKYKRDE